MALLSLSSDIGFSVNLKPRAHNQLLFSLVRCVVDLWRKPV